MRLYLTSLISQLINSEPDAITYAYIFEMIDIFLEDTEKEFQRRLQMVSAGLLTKEKFIAWYFNCDEREAINYIPQMATTFEEA